MKTKLFSKIFIAICLCVVVAFTFIACKDKEIYAETSDFESYPDYWNDFNEEIHVPNQQPSTPGETPDFSENDDDTVEPDTDGDGTPNKTDPDIDGDGTPNDKDPDIDGDDIPNEEDPDIDGDDIPNENDPDVDGSIGNDDSINQSPLVPIPY